MKVSNAATRAATAASTTTTSFGATEFGTGASTSTFASTASLPTTLAEPASTDPPSTDPRSTDPRSTDPASTSRSRTSTSYPWPNLALRCWADPMHLSAPSTKIEILPQSASASSMLWVVKTIELSSPSRAMTCHIRRLLTTSIPVDGSSRNITSGPPRVAMATLSLRLLPPLSEPATLSAKSVRSSIRRAFWTDRATRARGMPRSSE
mmetsp:Transcript_81692/g.231654  ORF Transcript_81692/g.231654 Transcript_81692/m.231654 type:complete len:208 (-) Transcript_81692:273-896(-)